MKTTIQLSVELKEFLEKQATRKAETYEEIIRRLIEVSCGEKIPEESSTPKVEAR